MSRSIHKYEIKEMIDVVAATDVEEVEEGKDGRGCKDLNTVKSISEQRRRTLK